FSAFALQFCLVKSVGRPFFVDLVFMPQLYHHLPEPAAVARECRRVLRAQSGCELQGCRQEGGRSAVPGQTCRKTLLPPRRVLDEDAGAVAAARSSSTSV